MESGVITTSSDTTQEQCKIEEESKLKDLKAKNYLFQAIYGFYSFDEKFRKSVRLGDDSKMEVMGKGNFKLCMNGIIQVISDVYYLPELKNNQIDAKESHYCVQKWKLQSASQR